MKLTDLIFEEILSELEKEEGCTSISRNELAQEIGCVPSQITYVVSSRFTPERGFIVESRRGGGGFIRITRIQIQQEDAFLQMISQIGDSIDEVRAVSILERLFEENIIDFMTLQLTITTMKNSVLRDVPLEMRDKVRASLLKNILVSLENCKQKKTLEKED